MTRLQPAAHVADILAPDRRIGNLSLALGGMLALASAMGIGRFVYTPILPPMAEALGLTKTAAGLIASANYLGYLAGGLLMAVPRLPGGRRPWFLAGLAVGAVTLAAMGLAGSMPAFLPLRFLGGMASAFVLVLGSALVLDRLAASAQAGLAAMHFAGVGVGIALSALLVGALQLAGADWRSLWFASGAMAFVVLPLVAWLVPGDDTPATPTPAIPPPRSARAGSLAWLSLCHGLFGFGYVVTATFLVAMVRAVPGSRPLELTIWVVVGLAAIPSTVLWGWIGRRQGALLAYGAACLIEAVGVTAGGICPGTQGALLAASLLGGTFMGITALGFAAARALALARQRRSFALMTAAFAIGQIAGPVIAGWLIDRTHGFVAPSLIGAAALLAAAAIAICAAGAPALAAGKTRIRADDAN